MEQLVYFGRLESASKKDSSGFWYRVNYLDLNNGRACQDYFDNVDDYKKLEQKQIPIGTKCVGIFAPNLNRKLVLVDAKPCK